MCALATQQYYAQYAASLLTSDIPLMQSLLLGQTGVLQLVADFNYDCSAAFATIEVFPMHPDATW